MTSQIHRGSSVNQKQMRNHIEGGVTGVPKTPKPHTKYAKINANRIGFFPEYRNRTYREAHYMKARLVVSFANIFMSAVSKSKMKPLELKRYMDDVFSLWDTEREEIDQFILEANRHHPTIKFTAEISDR